MFGQVKNKKKLRIIYENLAYQIIKWSMCIQGVWNKERLELIRFIRLDFQQPNFANGEGVSCPNNS